MNAYSQSQCLRLTKRILRRALQGSGNNLILAQPLINSLGSKRQFHSSQSREECHTLCEIQSRSLIQLSGTDTINFLQGLVTNDVHQLSEKSPSTQYCMMLNVQGRVLYDLFLYNISSQEKTTVLVDVDKSVKDELLRLFKRYKLRKKVDIADLSDQYKLWCQFTFSYSKDPQRTPLTFPDPRVPLFACRFVSDKQLNDTVDANVVDEQEYIAWRYRWGIPEGTVDLPPGNCLPLESNLSLMNGVNFQKGCYIGQELTARTFHTGVIRKRIVPLQLEVPAEIDPESTITTKSKGKNAGKFRNSVGEFGLGLLRMTHMKDDLVVTAKDGRNIAVKPCIPDWWPSGLV